MKAYTRVVQLVEHSAVNRVVVGSNPTPGAMNQCSIVVEQLSPK